MLDKVRLGGRSRFFSLPRLRERAGRGRRAASTVFVEVSDPFEVSCPLPNPPPQAGEGAFYFAPGTMMARTSAMISGLVA
jgi:hypothetical protein